MMPNESDDQSGYESEASQVSEKILKQKKLRYKPKKVKEERYILKAPSQTQFISDDEKV